MAPKRKSGKRRSKESGLVKGILIGLAVVGVLGGVWVVGSLIYNKAILPALAEQKAKKLRDAEEAMKPVVLPSGWRFYSRGQFQMLVPDRPQSDLPAPQRNPDGSGETPLYLASADGIEVYMSLFSVRPTPGRENFYDYYKFKGVPGILEFTSERQLEGSPRGKEAYSTMKGNTGFLRVYEDGPTSILMIEIQGDTQSEAFKNVVRSMSYQPTTSQVASADHTTPQTAYTAPAPTTRPGPSAPPPMASPPVNILALINTQQHCIAGDWGTRGHEVLSPVTEAAMLELPIPMEPSYEMNFEVERMGTMTESFNLAFPIGSNWGMVVLDGTQGTSSGLHLVNGQTSDTNPDSYEKPVFRPGKNHILLRVTPTMILLEVNSLTIVDWSGDPTTLSLEDDWKAGVGKAFIGTSNAEFVVSRIDFRIL